MSEDVEITVRIRKANLDHLRITSRAEAAGRRLADGTALFLCDDGTYRLCLHPNVAIPEEPGWGVVR